MALWPSQGAAMMRSHQGLLNCEAEFDTFNKFVLLSADISTVVARLRPLYASVYILIVSVCFIEL